MDSLIDAFLSIMNTQINQHSPLSTNFIEELIELIVTNRDLKDYYSKTTISFENSKDITTYNGLNVIKVYYNTLKQVLKIPEGQIFNNLEMNLYPLVIMIFCFFHEVEHVNQRKLYYSHISTPESRVIKASSIVLMPLNQFEALSEKAKQTYIDYAQKEVIKYQNYYNKFYQFAPTERMADIRVYEFLLQLLEQTPYFSDIQELYNYLSKKYFLNTTKAYNTNLCPTKYYLEQTQRRLAWLKLCFFTSNLPLDERIYLGTSITKEEFLSLGRRKENFKLNIP